MCWIERRYYGEGETPFGIKNESNNKKTTNTNEHKRQPIQTNQTLHGLFLEGVYKI
jgi:hypothetical protein